MSVPRSATDAPGCLPDLPRAVDPAIVLPQLPHHRAHHLITLSTSRWLPVLEPVVAARGHLQHAADALDPQTPTRDFFPQAYLHEDAAMTGAAIGTIRAEGKQTRRANAANAARVAAAMNKPRTVHVKKQGSIW